MLTFLFSIFNLFFLSCFKLSLMSITVECVNTRILEQISWNIFPTSLAPWYLYSSGVPQFGQTRAKQAKDWPSNMRESDLHSQALIFFSILPINWNFEKVSSCGRLVFWCKLVEAKLLEKWNLSNFCLNLFWGRHQRALCEELKENIWNGISSQVISRHESSWVTQGHPNSSLEMAG